VVRERDHQAVTDLDAVRCKARDALAQPGSLTAAHSAVPAQPGLYAIYGEAVTWDMLGLGEPPDGRPLYIGKAEESLVTRDLKTHFGDGRTGQSTVRRSFAALLHDTLGLRGMPRNPARPGYFSNYGLSAAHDAALTRWMREHLHLATISIDDNTDVEHVVAEFAKRDVQIGFTTLLRQCHGPTDEARFDLVHRFLRGGAAAATDVAHATRFQQLDAWAEAVIGLRDRSLDQRVRDRYVSEEGWTVFDYQEATRPYELIKILNYGDLIHWGRQRGKVLDPDEDEYAASMR